MPGGIVGTVEHVQEHLSNISLISPVHGNPVGVGWLGIGVRELGVDEGTVVGLLEIVTTSPDDHGEDEKNAEGDLGTDGATDALDVETVTPDGGGEDLGEPVQHAVQGAGAGVEVGAVHGVLLVDVEPVGDEEHGEEQEDEGLELGGLVQTPQLGLPAGVLHQDDAGAVLSDDIGCVDEEEGEDGTEEHEHDECDVRAIGDVSGLLDVDVGSEGNLWSMSVYISRVSGSSRGASLPIEKRSEAISTRK